MSITEPRTEPPFGVPRKPQLVHVDPPVIPTDAQISEIVGRPVASVLADTDLQRIALLVGALTYGDMKTLAAGILGKDEPAEVIVLADRLHDWATRPKEAA